MRKMIFTDMVSCTLTFSDGTTSKKRFVPDKDVMIIKLISKTNRITKFENEVLKNYSSARNATELAKLCNYKCFRTFTRHFNQSFNQTPYRWMVNQKLEDMHELVLNTDIAITEIANMYKYKSLSHFVNDYTKKYGVPPLKHRKVSKD